MTSAKGILMGITMACFLLITTVVVAKDSEFTKTIIEEHCNTYTGNLAVANMDVGCRQYVRLRFNEYYPPDQAYSQCKTWCNQLGEVYPYQGFVAGGTGSPAGDCKVGCRGAFNKDTSQ